MDSANFTPPARRSMSDAELAEALNQPHTDESSIMGAMKLLQEQSELRSADLMNEAAWVAEMKRINSVESLAAIESFLNGTFSTLDAFTPNSTDQDVPAVSLFEEIAQQKSATALDVIEASVESFEPQLPASGADPLAEFPAIFPLVPVAAAPDISVKAAAISETVAQQVAPRIENVEQKATEFEEEQLAPPVELEVSAELPVELEVSAELPVTSHLVEVGERSDIMGENAVASFDSFVSIEPISSSEVLHEVRTAVSTAHGPRTNQGASALFFNWLPMGGSILPVVLAVYLHSLGLSLTEAVIAFTLASFAAFATTSAGALAGKRAGLPTFVVSRATFGVFGARLPAAFFAVLKLFSASVMVLLLVIASQNALAGWSVEGPTATRWAVGPVSVALWQVIIGVSVLLVAVTSFIKLRYIKFLNLFVGVVASLGVFAALAVQLSSARISLHFDSTLSWPLTLGSSAILFAAMGSVWSSSGADFASLLKKSSKGSFVIAWSGLILFIVPSAIATATLVLLQNVDAKNELLGFASIVPAEAEPYAYGVFAAVVLLLAALELRSARLAVRGIYSRFAGPYARFVLALAFVAISLAGWHFYSTQGLFYNLKDYSLVLSVPVAAWLGIFSADSLMRRIAYHDISLTRSYGFYGNYNWINLFGWILASALGLGMLSSNLQEFGWVGFLARHSVSPAFWAQSNLGVALAFAVGVLVVLCLGVPRIKRQEAEVLSIEARRYELSDVLITAEIEQLANLSDTADSVI